MQVQNISIDSIKPYEKNPRKNDGAVDSVMKSIKEFGFKQPIVVDGNGVIVVGHTRYKAAKKLKLKEVPVLVASDLTEEQIKAYRLADNKTADFSIWDNKLLIEELESTGFDIFTGFDKAEFFSDILDENDNEVLENNKNGVEYIVRVSTKDEEKARKMLAYWEML